MNVLLNWIEFPEGVSTYLLKDVTPEDFNRLKLAHNAFINMNDESEEVSDAINFLTLYVEEYKEEIFSNWIEQINFPVEQFGKWKDFIVEEEHIIPTKDIDFVCVSGWYL